MMKHLEGRNLAHPGCLIGVTTGLIVGIILAGILAASFNVSFTMVSLIWLALTFVLGAIGWIIGSILTARARVQAHISPAHAEQQTGTGDSSSPSV